MISQSEGDFDNLVSIPCTLYLSTCHLVLLFLSQALVDLADQLVSGLPDSYLLLLLFLDNLFIVNFLKKLLIDKFLQHNLCS